MTNSRSTAGPAAYVLVTAARNEQDYIGQCIESVIGQTVQPVGWVIVSDGSTDRTDEIVRGYAKKHSFIRLLRKEKNARQKGFASKVFALNIGVDALKVRHYNFIGNLDADISFSCDYYQKIIDKFCNSSRLGLAGGYIFEKKNNKFESRRANSPWSVAGGIQLFRRECYFDIGGLKPLPLGGEDWLAEIQAKMHGWDVNAFPDIHAYHHKPSAYKRGVVKEALREGAMDYAMGVHPLYELVKSIRRIKQNPYVIFALVRLMSFFTGYFKHQPKVLKRDEINFLRQEQLKRIKTFFSNFIRNDNP